MFSDIDNDGQVDENEIIQEEHYYPFGMRMEGYGRTITHGENDYQYNGKELNTDFGLDMYDYGARFYDASVSRWFSIDPLAQEFYSLSIYNFVKNNPIIYIDPDGKYPIITINKEDKTITISETLYYSEKRMTQMIKMANEGNAVNPKLEQLTLEQILSNYQNRVDGAWSGCYEYEGETWTVVSQTEFKAYKNDEELENALDENEYATKLTFTSNNLGSSHFTDDDNGYLHYNFNINALMTNADDYDQSIPAHEKGHGLGLNHDDVEIYSPYNESSPDPRSVKTPLYENNTDLEDPSFNTERWGAIGSIMSYANQQTTPGQFEYELIFNDLMYLSTSGRKNKKRNEVKYAIRTYGHRVVPESLD